MPTEKEISEQWLEQLRAGDDLSLNRIMARWQRPLLSFALRYLRSESDAEDVVIETFVRLYRNRRKLRPRSNLSAWLFTTLSRLCLNHLRWRRRHPSVAGTPDPDPPSETDQATPWSPEPAHPANTLESAERLQVLKETINRLPHREKTILLLHTYEQASLREIAAVVGGSEKSVEARLYRLRKQLRTELGPFLDSPEPVRTTAPPA